MPATPHPVSIADVLLREPASHGDARGRFVETYRREWLPLGREMVQGNRSEKQAGAVVGLHYHLHQADYWYVLRGTARVVLHDLRVGSPTEKTTFSVDLDGDDERGLFIPPGVAHGFASLTDVLCGTSSTATTTPPTSSASPGTTRRWRPTGGSPTRCCPSATSATLGATSSPTRSGRTRAFAPELTRSSSG